MHSRTHAGTCHSFFVENFVTNGNIVVKDILFKVVGHMENKI